MRVSSLSAAQVREAHEAVEAELELVLQHQDALHRHLAVVEAAIDDELGGGGADSLHADRAATERQVRARGSGREAGWTGGCAVPRS